MPNFTGAMPVPPRPFGDLRWTDHFKPVARATIPVRSGHASDEKKFVRANPSLLCVKQFIAQMKTLD
jgi:hypothetical protein